MPFAASPSAQCFFFPVWLCWHASLFLVDCVVASLFRSLSLFLSFWCCALHRVALVLWWAVYQAEVSVAQAAHLGVSPWHMDALVEGERRAQPGEAPLRRQVLLLVAELGSAGVDPGPRRAGCVYGSAPELGFPPESSCCASLAVGSGSVPPAPLSCSLGVAWGGWGGRTVSLLFLWLVEGRNLGRKAKMHHKQKMLLRANRLKLLTSHFPLFWHPCDASVTHLLFFKGKSIPCLF